MEQFNSESFEAEFENATYVIETIKELSRDLLKLSDEEKTAITQCGLDSHFDRFKTRFENNLSQVSEQLKELERRTEMSKSHMYLGDIDQETTQIALPLLVTTQSLQVEVNSFTALLWFRGVHSVSTSSGTGSPSTSSGPTSTSGTGNASSGNAITNLINRIQGVLPAWLNQLLSTVWNLVVRLKSVSEWSIGFAPGAIPGITFGLTFT